MLIAGNDATPPTAATVNVPASVPPAGLALSATATFPVKLSAGSPSTSCAAITSGVGEPDGMSADAAGPLVSTSFVAGFGAPVALKVTGEPARLATVAVAVWLVADVPRVHVVCASPVASVTTDVAPTEPPLPAANATVTPATPRPSPAVTLTTIGCASACGVGLPMTPDWLLPDATAIAVATGMTLRETVSDAPLISCAMMRAVPREALAEPDPTVATGIVAMVGSGVTHTTGALATVAPVESTATVVNANAAPAFTVSERGEILSVLAVAPGPL